jgi:superfamily II DNA or RNA helicase
MINRFSSRRQKLDTSFLNDRLEGARSYDRIAGYFSSSILEVAGEAIDSVTGTIRVVCNSQLEAEDVKTSMAAYASIRKEWCGKEPEKLGKLGRERFARLYAYLKSGKLQVRILPDTVFGLVHGKAGVITRSDGTKTSFMGSTNETYSAWRLNYEILWEDNSEEAVQWVQEEFDALWNHPKYIELSDFVIEDIGRIAHREVIRSLEEWRENPDPGSVVVESPVYRKEIGLWEHQKYFINHAFTEHQTAHGARLILADMVGLGKTLQLAMTAQLIALTGERPILILTPATLRWQWQDELRDLLDLPSAVWEKGRWVDEEGIEHPKIGDEGVLKCPRRIGIISYGLITHGYRNDRSQIPELLLSKRYDCIIVDEAHKARRSNLGKTHENEKAIPNKLLAFLVELSVNTKSIFLATATPVQIHPIEAFDLLSILASGKNQSVLGDMYSRWRKEAFRSLEIICSREQIPDDDLEVFKWIANPFPPASQGRDFEILRRSLEIPENTCVIAPSRYIYLSQGDKARIERIKVEFFQFHNPYIRSIVRRTRKYLEETNNPETGEPYLRKIDVKLYGEDERDAIPLTTYLQDAYTAAEEFCQLLGKREKGTGFLKTLLLRRVGSSLYAGRSTANTMLGNSQDLYADSDDEEDVEGSDLFRQMSEEEKALLRRFSSILEAHMDNDPKYVKVIEILKDWDWIGRGCIIFSQYYDTIEWISKKLQKDFFDQKIAIYAGSNRSRIIEHGIERRASREEIKLLVRRGEIKLLLGTDAASEGLNLQTLGSLINLDLPWNPTRLEQRKGRIQRIGQVYDDVWIYNMRYRGSVEDRVHELLSERLESINSLFGQIPDVLEDVWINVALDKIEDAKTTIATTQERHPFEIRYDKIEPVDWESCTKVLDNSERKKHLMKGW